MQKLSLALFSLAATLAAGGGTTVPGGTTLSDVPEPSTYLMMAAGVGAIAIARYRKSKKK